MKKIILRSSKPGTNASIFRSVEKKETNLISKGLAFGFAESVGRILGELVVETISSYKFKKEEAKPEKTKLEPSNYELLNKNLKKKLDANPSPEEEIQILRQMNHNYSKIAELKGDDDK